MQDKQEALFKGTPAAGYGGPKQKKFQEVRCSLTGPQGQSTSEQRGRNVLSG